MTAARPPIPSGPPTATSEELAARLAQLRQNRAVAGSDRTPQTPGATKPSNRRSRRHPAKVARVAAMGLSLASTAGLSAYFVQSAAGAPHQVGAATIASGSTESSAGGSPWTVTNAPDTTASAPATTAPAVDTVVNGATFQNKWGPVQVQATFGAGGDLVSVDTIQTPNDRGTSIEINNAAVPQLDAAAVSAQSANVHTVSGATYTSTDYQRSLQSAIDAARAAGVTQIV